MSAQDTAQILQSPWPGNVRQLINVAERAILQSRRGGGSLSSLLMVDSEQVPAVVTTDGKPLKEYVEAFERMLIDNTMRRQEGQYSGRDGRVEFTTPHVERKNGKIWIAAVRLSLGVMGTLL